MDHTTAHIIQAVIHIIVHHGVLRGHILIIPEDHTILAVQHVTVVAAAVVAAAVEDPAAAVYYLSIFVFF